jgi:hypothetical protein
LSKIKFFRLNPFIISEMNYASDEQNAWRVELHVFRTRKNCRTPRF